MSVNIITAVGRYVPGKGYPIGKNGKLPWHNAKDLTWFRETTMGHPVIMGRKTYESLETHLKGRTNIIVTENTSPIKADYGDAIIAIQNSVEDAVKYAKTLDSEVFIIGGASIYKYALEHDLVDCVMVDMLSENADDADTFFPEGIFSSNEWASGDAVEIEPRKAYAITYVKLRGLQNHVDDQYLKLINEIIEHGEEKNTRAGKARSVFSRQMRFNLKEGFPLLTTKKVFTKGIIHELLWFLKGDTNIKYLADNGVHIWDDDAYRYYLELMELNEDTEVLTKEQFMSSLGKSTFLKHKNNDVYTKYVYGDLNNVYGYQWTKWGGHNQIQEVIDMLKKNPDDRRMIVSAWNVSDVPNMALPPCHYCCQFYTKKMTLDERIKWACEHNNQAEESIGENVELLDEWNVPTRKLSCVWHQRSVDSCSGLPFNISSYCILTHMIAQCVNMEVDELIFDGGDCHVYENQIPIYKNQQMNRNPHMYALPKLELNPDVKNIFDFKYEDIKIVGYQSYPAIKFPLNVGL